jgi:polyhydroxyalkanoate synthesis regulator protein
MATTATRTEAAFTGLLDQAVATFGDAMKAGVKFQEDIGRWWSDVLDQTAPVQTWQKRSREMVSEAIPAAQRNAEEWMKVVEQNYRRSLELMRRALETENPATVAEAQTRMQDLWEASMQVIRDNAQAMAQANLHMMEAWAEILRKNLNGGRAGAAKMAAR